jgi:hypothetical protein
MMLPQSKKPGTLLILDPLQDGSPVTAEGPSLILQDDQIKHPDKRKAAVQKLPEKSPVGHQNNYVFHRSFTEAITPASQ